MPRPALREFLSHKRRPSIFLRSRCPLSLCVGKSALLPANSRQTASSFPLSFNTISHPMSTAKPIRHRLVVSSFLCVGTPHTESFRISVFKRSGLVRSYQYKWAACSGRMEESDSSPRDAALREILEETAIGVDELELLAEGKEKEIVDEDLGVKWTIYPFLWRWKGDKNIEGGDEWAENLRNLIKLDWEHTDVRIVKFEDLVELDTVDDLSDTISRTLMASKH